mgnify:CR=1 FL=1
MLFRSWITFGDESRNIKNSIYNKKMIEAENIARNIINEKEEELNKINNEYQSNKSELVEDVFKRIIKPLKE